MSPSRFALPVCVCACSLPSSTALQRTAGFSTDTLAAMLELIAQAKVELMLCFPAADLAAGTGGRLLPALSARAGNDGIRVYVLLGCPAGSPAAAASAERAKAALRAVGDRIPCSKYELSPNRLGPKHRSVPGPNQVHKDVIVVSHYPTEFPSPGTAHQRTLIADRCPSPARPRVFSPTPPPAPPLLLHHLPVFHHLPARVGPRLTRLPRPQTRRSLVRRPGCRIHSTAPGRTATPGRRGATLVSPAIMVHGSWFMQNNVDSPLA